MQWNGYVASYFLKVGLRWNNLLWRITRKVWLALRMNRLGRLWEMASRNVCRRLVFKTSPVKIGELLSIIFFILLGIIMIWPNNIFGWLHLRFLRFWDPDNEWQMEQIFRCSLYKENEIHKYLILTFYCYDYSASSWAVRQSKWTFHTPCLHPLHSEGSSSSSWVLWHNLIHLIIIWLEPSSRLEAVT